jgi:hypothetical protein
MHSKLALVLVFLVLIFVGCSKTSEPVANNAQPAAQTGSPSIAVGSPAAATGAPVAPAEASAVTPKVDTCALLTTSEVEAVQGEAIKETKLSGQATGGFNMSQCFFTLPTFTNSISLLVAHRGDGAGAHDPKDFWRETFHERERGDKERERERERDKKARSEEEEEGAPPQKVTGVGDEAYWTGSRIGGALYVLKGNSYLRISIGGPADQATKMKKSKTLAQKALSRM